MKLLSILFLSILLASCGGGGSSYYPLPAKPDLSGVVLSEYKGGVQVPEGEGWNKGWVASDDKVVLVEHANPRKGNVIYCIDPEGKKHNRTITEIEFIKSPSGVRTDTAVATVDSPWPDSIERYEIAEKRPGAWWVTHNGLRLSARNLSPQSIGTEKLIGSTGNANNYLVQGESGLPWFNFNGQVVSHTTQIDFGIGPNYAHPTIRPLLIEAISNENTTTK